MKTRHFAYCMFKCWMVIACLCLTSLMEVQAQPTAGIDQANLTRYVDKNGGAYGNDGLSWSKAKNLIQEAINDLHTYMQKNGITEGGQVFVKEGIYTPIESTETAGNSVLHTSFKIYEGITLYGGFKGGETSPDEREMKPTNGNFQHGWEFAHPTVLNGNHAANFTEMKWDSIKQTFYAVYPGNSYHVVWFATNGFSKRKDLNNELHADSLKYKAGLDGFIIEGGHSSYNNLVDRKHTAYGGGVYMVHNSFLRNCVVRKNKATRRGGAIYMDGGGLVEQCYIHSNFASGIGGLEGYGGGVAVDQKGVVRHSVIVNNMARIGGGAALSYSGPLSEKTLEPSMVTCLIANNTAAQEAGGIVFNGGGAVNHLTVARNRCNGQDITINNIRYGRSAGAYVLYSGHIYNSVFWGGTVKNRNIQFAAFNPSRKVDRVRLNFSAIENHDITDWNAIQKTNVVNIEGLNMPVTGDLISNYVAFINPSDRSGVLADDNGNILDFQGLGVNWQPKNISALQSKSIQIFDLTNLRERLFFRHIEEQEDIHGGVFDPRDAVGVLKAAESQIQTVSLDGVTTLFVDPSYKTLSAEKVGNSWDNPLNNLNEALQYFKKSNMGGRVLMKEGVWNITGNSFNRHMRSSNVEMVSNVVVLGGYSSALKGTDTSLRDPMKYVTRISGDIADDAYSNNACHLVAFNNVSHAEINGIHISYGNAASTALFDTDPAMNGKPQFQHGAGVLLRNTQVDPYAPRYDMLDNRVKNCVISNCTALSGSAVYVLAEAGTQVELFMENCIIHNNHSLEIVKPASTIYVGGKGTATLFMDHCNVMKNVGHPILTDSPAATVLMTNSIIWANARKILPEFGTLSSENAADLLRFNQGIIVNINPESSHCMFDEGTTMPIELYDMVSHLSCDVTNQYYPKFSNPTKNVGVSEHDDITVYGGVPDHTPDNMNPLVNYAKMVDLNSVGTDFRGKPRNYGGRPDVGAMENTDLPQPATSAKGGVFYVSIDAPSAKDASGYGTSWNQPFKTLTYALSQAKPGNRIWVAQGVYTSTPKGLVSNQKAAYQMIDGVDVLGGFPNYGTPSLKERNPKKYRTILQASEVDYSAPDVMLPNASVGRVLAQDAAFKIPTIWDGFTIRNGYLYESVRVNLDNNIDNVKNTLPEFIKYGGSGVLLQTNGILENCEVVNNVGHASGSGTGWGKLEGIHQAGGGVMNYGGTVKNCIISKNKLLHLIGKPSWSLIYRAPWLYGGGLFNGDGEVYNTIISDNECRIYGSGTPKNESVAGSGVFIVNGKFYNNTIIGNIAETTAPDETHIVIPGVYVFSNITMYNCIIAKNISKGDLTSGVSPVVDYPVCAIYMEWIQDTFWGSGHYEPRPYISAVNAHYCVIDIDENNAHNLVKRNTKNTNNLFYPNAEDIKINPDYTLDVSSPCINRGTENIVGVTIPKVDARYKARVQDCVIDMGAFEFDGSSEIHPDVQDTVATFYVTQNGSMVADASSPQNASCATKLQKVLHMAGKYKLANPTHTVVVKLAGNNAGIKYQPTESRMRDITHPDFLNPRTRSLLVPKGVVVEGGWKEDFTARDIIAYKTILYGLYQDILNEKDAEVYHTVTFTDVTVDGSPMTVVTDRAVLDGLFLEGGRATGENEIDKYGGAAIVPGYAHIQNCIFMNNNASKGGGALLLLEKSLVSGSLFTNNQAKDGGAIYVKQLEDASENEQTRARIYTSTFVDNTALKAGGGIWFYNNVRVNSTVFWRNNGNTQADVAGKYEDNINEYTVEAYPFAYSAVENVRMPGINNQSVATNNDQGVRFIDHSVDGYYGLTEYSVLARGGMPIEDYRLLMNQKILKLHDFKGIQRIGTGVDGSNIDENFYIDMGARSLGKRTIVPPEKGKILKRIFVTHPELVNMDNVQTMIDYVASIPNIKDVPVNAYQGGSFAYPMQHLDDALRYIIKVRKDKSIDNKDKENFEIFISGGTFYPNYTMDGNTGYSRFNTFLVPEGVAIRGGVDHKSTAIGYYCQDSIGTPKSIGTINFEAASTETILSRRELYDLNSNDIYEPWEMLHQTILSGRNINKEEVDEVYHVITISTVPQFVGDAPSAEPKLIQIDGVQIMDGKAWTEDLQEAKSPSLFAGGGIHADGILSINPDGSNAQYRKIPLRITHCRFLGNSAGWGGAVYSNLPMEISASSFEQNTVNSKDVNGLWPIDVQGQGAALFAGNVTQIANCLFANNEAKDILKRGLQPNPGEMYGAGTIALYDLAYFVMMNSNMVNNQAQKYPAVFAHKSNDQELARQKKHHNVVVNSLFWGNKALDGGQSQRYNHVINFNNPDNLDASEEALWFCAYERGCGRTPVNNQDFRATPIAYEEYIPDKLGENNCNIYLNSDNYALDGPNFSNPSLGPGSDSFMVTANWLPYRQNNLTDNGWTFLKQKITNDGNGTYHCMFVDDAGNPGISGAGAYYIFHQSVINRGYGQAGVPIGNTTYMKDKSQKDMLRVSLDPNPSHQQTYIDVGLYEYQHIQLEVTYGEHIDTLWVSELEKPENGTADGSSWEKPTSDLQRAIETLLCSRNGHGKVLCIMQGSYHPVYFFEDNLGFRIDTKGLNESVITTKDEAQKGIGSLTFSGGWNNQIKEKRNIEECPTYISISQRGGVPAENMKYLMDINDARQFYGRADGSRTDGTVIPIIFDGLTFMNNKGRLSPGDKGGTAIYYREQLQDAGAGLCKASGNPKLKVANCIFLNNSVDETTPAVKVENGGGRALIYNSLFHSNKGISVVSDDTAKVVNCTFALNGGNVQLKSAGSHMYANVLWKNNLAASFKGEPECEMTEFGTNFMQNAYTDSQAKVGSLTIGDNWILSTDNSDIYYGPNFVNPHLDAQTLDEMAQRDFHLQPSIPLLNKTGDLYWRFLDPALTEASYDTAFAHAIDLSGKPRRIGKKLDLGAYEYQLPLQRIIYVDPLRAQSSGNGSSWEFAYNAHDIQKAVDMAAVYAAGNVQTGLEQGKGQAYVYVKSRNDNGNTGLTVTLQDGVSIYGSIPQTYMAMAEGKMEESVMVYTQEQAEAYERKIRMERPGLVDPSEYATVLLGVNTNANSSYKKMALLDGFEITADNIDSDKARLINDNPTIPALSLISDGSPTESAIVVRNALVHGFHKNEAPVVDVKNGLLYNVLVRDNTVQLPYSHVDLGDKGWVVNCTMVSGQQDVSIFHGLQEQVIHSIAGTPDLATFTPQLSETNLEVPAFKTGNPNLCYQLSEDSPDINKRVDLQGLPAVFSHSSVIEYAEDRDVLGNPRKMGKVDNGCFETWLVGKNATVMATTKASGLRYFPHIGSVVYMKDNSNLVFRTLQNDGITSALPSHYVFAPGYLMMHQGTSLYASGAAVKVDYMTLEKRFSPIADDGQIWSLVSLPFDFKMDQLKVKKNNSVEKPVKAEFYSYDGSARAAFDYSFATDESPLWKRLPETATRPANNGFLLHIPHQTDGKEAYWFTAVAPASNQYVYSEDGKPKMVTLNQYNHTPADGTAHFTSLENMGWNLFGQPYLVNSYQTGGVSADDIYPMNMPHVIYGMDDQTGNYLYGESWKDDSRMEMGRGYFTQTAALGMLELVSFDLPVYEAGPATQRLPDARIQIKGMGGKDEVTIRPNADVDEVMDYRLGVDAVKWMGWNADVPQIFASNSAQTNFSLMADAPVEKEIALGVKAGDEGSYIFSVPESVDFNGYGAVWLKDAEKDVCVNLLEEDYSVNLLKNEDCKNRFTVKFAVEMPGQTDMEGDRNPYQVYAADSHLYVRGLEGGELVNVYATDGRNIARLVADEPSFEMEVPAGVYLININQYSYKVVL